jgi:hypothetical protein
MYHTIFTTLLMFDIILVNHFVDVRHSFGLQETQAASADQQHKKGDRRRFGTVYALPSPLTLSGARVPARTQAHTRAGAHARART